MAPQFLKSNQDSISIIIPVYRAVKSLKEIILKLEDLNVKEIIFVFDCGCESSWREIENLSRIYSNVIGIHLNRNYGQHNATICGFEFATGDLIVTMDEDLQHDPIYIPALQKKLYEEDLDLVYANYKAKNSLHRNVTSKLLKKLLQFGIPQLHKDYTSFRLLRKEIAKLTLPMKNSYTFLDGYLCWITDKVSSVSINHKAGELKSSYNNQKLIEHSINIFTTFSNLPIKFLTYSSVLFFIMSSGYAVYLLITTLVFNNYMSGFPTIAILLGFGFGFTLLGMGILGEYLRKINSKTTNRPNYTIKKIIKSGDPI